MGENAPSTPRPPSGDSAAAATASPVASPTGDSKVNKRRHGVVIASDPIELPDKIYSCASFKKCFLAMFLAYWCGYLGFGVATFTLGFIAVMAIPGGTNEKIEFVDPIEFNPHIMSVDWFNIVIAHLHTMFVRVIEMTLRDKLEAEIEEFQSLGKIPDIIATIDVSQLSFTRRPLRIRSIKSGFSPDATDDVVVDIDLQLLGETAIGLSVATRRMSIVIPFSVTLSEFSAVFRLDILVLSRMPLAGIISFGFAHNPKIEVNARAGKLQVMELPGVADVILGLLTNKLSRFLVYPNRVIVPIGDSNLLSEKMGMACDPTVVAPGRLHCAIISSESLPVDEHNGLANAYAVIRLGKQRRRTSTATESASPYWGQRFTLTVANANEDFMEITIYDSGTLGSDEKLGDVIINLRLFVLSPGLHDIYCDLQRARKGKLHLMIFFEPKGSGISVPPALKAAATLMGGEDDALMSGWLVKKEASDEGTFSKSKKARRYFILDEDSLSYYKDEHNNTNPVGVIPGYAMQFCYTDSDAPTVFSLLTSDTTYIMFADSADATEEWVKKLQDVMKKVRFVEDRGYEGDDVHIGELKEYFIKLRVIQARNLKTDLTGEAPSSYVLAKIGSHSIKSPMIEASVNPKYDWETEIRIDRKVRRVEFEVYDTIFMKDRNLGTASVDLGSLWEKNPKRNLWCKLKGVKRGELNVELSFRPPDEYQRDTDISETNRRNRMSSHIHGHLKVELKEMRGLSMSMKSQRIDCRLRVGETEAVLQAARTKPQPAWARGSIEEFEIRDVKKDELVMTFLAGATTVFGVASVSVLDIASASIDGDVWLPLIAGSGEVNVVLSWLPNPHAMDGHGPVPELAKKKKSRLGPLIKGVSIGQKV